jgi:hypothetical protein
MQEWIDALCAELGIAAEVDVTSVLDVARDAAHNVERPAAPVSTYLMGIAVANGADATAVAAKVAALAKGWSATS